jgi:AP-2 complex subunit mu-1
MISAIYLINLKGEVLIYRSYRDDVSRAAADAFRMQVLAAKEFRSPVQVYEKASFFHIRSANVYLVAATRENVNASMVFEFLYQLVGGIVESLCCFHFRHLTHVRCEQCSSLTLGVLSKKML